ncbi:MAG: hypothetical protein F6K21_24825 [Symploca sp. SIO2D2]|nr:hypothetical protein [Symploca sp. SIO2D2]
MGINHKDTEDTKKRSLLAGLQEQAIATIEIISPTASTYQRLKNEVWVRSALLVSEAIAYIQKYSFLW